MTEIKTKIMYLKRAMVKTIDYSSRYMFVERL